MENTSVFGKVLVANRGEIAVRIFRTLRELGVGAVGVYAEPDRASLHVSYADEAFLVESYLSPEALVEISRVESLRPPTPITACRVRMPFTTLPCG